MWIVRTHSLLLHLLEKLDHLLQLPILHMFCKLPIACKYVEFLYTWCQSSTQSASHVCLCLKSGYLSFVDDQKSGSIGSAMYSPHPRNQWYDKNRERCSDLLQQHIALTYILQPATTPPPVHRTWNEILHSLDQGRIATTNGERKDWHQQEVWLHRHVNSNRFDVRLPYLIYDPDIAKDP